MIAPAAGDRPWGSRRAPEHRGPRDACERLMKIFDGIPVSDGVVIGRAFLIDQVHRRVAQRVVGEAGVEAELDRFERARQASIADLQRVAEAAGREIGDEAAKIFLFHQGMLHDRTLIDPIRVSIRDERVCAEWAVSRVLGAWRDRFASMPDTAISTKADDIADLTDRILTELIGARRTALSQAEPGAIVIARELTPTQVVELAKIGVGAIALDTGGTTSHTAIVARAVQLPAVLGCRTLFDEATDDAMIALDGRRGRVILEPNEPTLARYREVAESRREARRSLRDEASLVSETADGVRVELLGNIEFADEAEAVLESGGEGVGLFRTEFLFLTSDHEPSEEEQFESYRRCVELLGGQPLTIRTLDLGADKYTQQKAEAQERNPFLGCRSIRYSLRRLPMFRAQIRAILRASALGPVKMMFPLITSIGEFRQARLYVRDVMEDMAEEGLAFDADLPIGMMVEVPSAAVLADRFAREADFFSIGTNDLVQYTLAVDRTNEQVADLYQPTHPAVIRLIREVVKAGRHRSVPVSCCGETAGDPEYALLLIGLGVRTLSASASSLPLLKRVIRSVTRTQCERIARKALTFDSAAEVSSYLRDQARRAMPEALGGRSVEEV